MAIHEGILRRFAAEYVIVMKDDQTLEDAIQCLGESGYSQEQSYLVVEIVKPEGELYQASDPYGVTPFSALHELLPTHLIQPLVACPIPAPMRVERQDTSESGKSIGDWVTTTADATLVVIDDNGFVALLVNTHLGPGGSRQGSIFKMAALISGKENCPHCKKNEGFEFENDIARCEACEKKFKVVLNSKKALIAGEEDCPFCDKNEGFEFDDTMATCNVCKERFAVGK